MILNHKAINHKQPLAEIDTLDDSAMIRLIYTSKMTVKSRLQTKIFANIQSVATARNQERNVRGFLCYGNGYFLQCLEGEKRDILDLITIIAKDARHKEVTIATAYPITARCFTEWSMRSIFLERWLWSSASKKEAEILKDYLTFKPTTWSNNKTQAFVDIIAKLKTEPQRHQSLVTYNAFWRVIQHVAGPHQAFIVVQGILGLMATILVLMSLPIL